MKRKFKEALQQEYKNLGLSESVFERVAAPFETFITDENAIEGLVKSEAIKGLVTSYQSEADKVRTASQAKIAELEAKLAESNKLHPPKQEDKDPDLAQLIAETVATKMSELVEPLKSKISALEDQHGKDAAVVALDNFCSEWSYAKGFPEQSEEAYRIAMKVFRAGGEKMSGEELIAAYREEFDPAVKKKGITDFSKPFDSQGSHADDSLDTDEVRRALEKSGRLPKS